MLYNINVNIYFYLSHTSSQKNVEMTWKPIRKECVVYSLHMLSAFWHYEHTLIKCEWSQTIQQYTY